MTADPTADVVTSPEKPDRRSRRVLHRAGLLTSAVIAGFVGFAVPAEATDTYTMPVRGSAYSGTAPVSACSSEFVEEYRYPTEGYRITGSCRSLADWTEARAVSNWPTHAYNATEWFGYVQRDYWSDFRAQVRLPVGTLHPRDTEIEYRPAGTGVRLWTGNRPATGDEERTVTVTTPSDASGHVEIWWEKSFGTHLKITEGSISGGRTDLRIPLGAIEAGSNQAIFATFGGDATYPAMRTSAGGIEVKQPTARPTLSLPYTHVPAGTDTEVTVSLPHAEGPVDVVDGAEGDRTVGTVEMRGGRGILTTSLAEGEHQLRAVHRGDTRFLPGESDPVTMTVFEPRIEVESATLQPGDTLRATATLPVAASGRVQFLLTWPGNMAGIGSADVVDGTATFSVPVDRIGAGTFGLAADHRGGDGFMPSRSEPVTISISGTAGAAETPTTDTTGPAADDSGTAQTDNGDDV